MKHEQRVAASSEEYVPEDDRIIGKAFRWSLAGIALLALAAGAVYWLNRKEAQPITVIEQEKYSAKSVAPEVEPPSVAFTEIGAAVGVDFVRENGARGERLLPETMGGGVAIFDKDNDGDQDLLLINGEPWPTDRKQGEALPTLALYENDGRGHFSNVTSGSGLAVSLCGMGVAIGDADQDGDSDVFVSAVGESRLFRNDGANFSDVTASSGVGGTASDWGTSAAFFDLENDGDLDLFVCRYVRWSRAIDIEVDYRLTGVGRAYGPPMNFSGSYCSLYRNEGSMRFQDISKEAGIQVQNPATGVPVAKALGVSPLDIDDDGFVDLVVANDTVPKFLFRNQGNGTFVECGAKVGIAFDRSGNATGAMGIDSAYYRQDGALGIAVGNFANEMSALYVSQAGRAFFVDEAIPEGIGAATRAYLSFGLFFFDYDLDGRLDLLQANGHLEQEINTVQSSQHYEQPAQLFWNAGPTQRTTFVEVKGAASGDLSQAIVGRGSAYGDLDQDGDLDVVLVQPKGRPLVLRNDQALGHHYLRLQLEGTSSNREAIGARVELEAGGVTQRQMLFPARSYLSSSERILTFGLGQTTEVDSLRVRWPSGKQQVVPVTKVDQTLIVREE